MGRSGSWIGPGTCNPAKRCGLFGVAGFCLLATFCVDAHVQAWARAWRTSPVDPLVGVLNPLGSGVTLLIVCVFLYGIGRLACQHRLRHAAGLGTWAFIFAGLVEFLIKHLVGRPRPEFAALGLLPRGPSWTPGFDSFPS